MIKYLCLVLVSIISIVLLISCTTNSTPVYTLTTTINPVEGGEIIPNKGSYDEGEVVSLQAIPTDGWMFSRWEQDLNTTANPMNITMNRDHNIVGVFEQRMHPLTITVEGEGMVTETVVTSKTTDYAEGTIIELKAEPAEDWTFSHWEEDLSGAENPVELIVDKPITISAVFENFIPVTNPITGRTWMDRNLGASSVATNDISDFFLAYGDLYQWGRGADGHQIRNSGTTATLSSSDQPGHGSFILTNSDWRILQNDNLWQGVNGINNPCPNGYRIPVWFEWVEEQDSWHSNTAAGAFASSLKLPMAGGRNSRTGSLFGVSSSGNYWSSTVWTGHLVDIMIISDSTAPMSSRGIGASVRCIKD